MQPLVLCSRPKLINGTDSTIKHGAIQPTETGSSIVFCAYFNRHLGRPSFIQYIYHDNYVFPFFTALHRLRVRGGIEENSVVYTCSVSLICTGTLIFLGSTDELWFFAKYKMVAKLKNK